jgi:hypothetical protein
MIPTTSDLCQSTSQGRSAQSPQIPRWLLTLESILTMGSCKTIIEPILTLFKRYASNSVVSGLIL